MTPDRLWGERAGITMRGFRVGMEPETFLFRTSLMAYLQRPRRAHAKRTLPNELTASRASDAQRLLIRFPLSPVPVVTVQHRVTERACFCVGV